MPAGSESGIVSRQPPSDANRTWKRTAFIVPLVVAAAALTGLVLNQREHRTAQSGLTDGIVEINGHAFRVEIADSADEHELGLSYRDSLEADRGMLFVFPDAVPLTFWMRGMHFPLDIVFIRDGVIVRIAEDVPEPNGGIPEIVDSGEPADMVLEINAGLSRAYGFEAGQAVSIDF
jgi:uncharacterized membrane protein (UPF0127 family)